jgi:hypothetical protein
LTFSVGAPLVAFVGANIGANQMTRALRIALSAPDLVMRSACWDYVVYRHTQDAPWGPPM